MIVIIKISLQICFVLKLWIYQKVKAYGVLRNNTYILCCEVICIPAYYIEIEWTFSAVRLKVVDCIWVRASVSKVGQFVWLGARWFCCFELFCEHEKLYSETVLKIQERKWENIRFRNLEKYFLSEKKWNRVREEILARELDRSSESEVSFTQERKEKRENKVASKVHCEVISRRWFSVTTTFFGDEKS